MKHTVRKILLLAETTFCYGRGIIEGVNEYSRDKNWEIMFEPRGIGEQLPDRIDAWKWDGAISRLIDRESIKRLRRHGIPVVELGGNAKKCEADVIPDEDKIAELAADHLTGCGFRHYACFSYGDSWWARSRTQAFHRAMEMRGYRVATHRAFLGFKNNSFNYWSLEEQRKLKKWLLELPKPCGMFVINDYHARDVLQTCHQLGISIPHEIGVIGVDDDRWFCGFFSPSLSSIDTNGFLAGLRAAELLDSLMRGKPRAEKPIAIPPLHVSARQSTNAVIVDDPDVADALLLIRDKACDGLTVAELTEQIGLSQKTLERRFRKVLFRTPEQEILRLRVEKAKDLLRNTDLLLNAIYHRSGFQSLANFFLIFKRLTGTTPNVYRTYARGICSDSFTELRPDNQDERTE